MKNFNKIKDSGSLWGGLYEPSQCKSDEGKGLRTAVFGSTNAGALVVASLIRFEEKFPHLLNLVGVATDDPVDPDARISAQKRIWKNYNPKEMNLLMDKVITTASDAGLPCYTGSVKTDYFRTILTGWNPDVIIMCCFGQKIDSFIFNYPRRGMYNFHPSDLAANIGTGLHPFTDTIGKGRKASTMTVHIVTETIDRGAIIGNSPAVNICLANGDYPKSVLTLQEKVPAICGWMSIELILEVIKNQQSGKDGAISSIDFNANMPDAIREKLLEPTTDDLNTSYTLPLHDKIK
jgi:folate-dependent phosphoribosylglycinamide formyltransferase PurN